MKQPFMHPDQLATLEAIAETGTFSELVQHGGYFSAMYKLAH